MIDLLDPSIVMRALHNMLQRAGLTEAGSSGFVITNYSQLSGLHSDESIIIQGYCHRGFSYKVTVEIDGVRSSFLRDIKDA